MARILVGECKQEVSSFNPVPSHIGDFDISIGADILDFHRGGRSEMAGALSVFDIRPSVEVVPSYSARAITSGGPLSSSDFHRIAEALLAGVRNAMPVDAAYFCLHGAMSAEGEDDPEGYLLAEIREMLGEQVPIVVSLDLHGVLTDRMLRHCDAVVPYHTYPHVDFFETGERAARLLLRILDGEVKPVTARVKIPALVRGDELITETGLFGGMIRAAQAIERSDGGLAAGMFIGNPFTDVAELRSNSLVVTDNDPDRAERDAIKLADAFWHVRHRLQASLMDLDEAARIAAETVGQGTTVLVDAADATSSGASGDSNAILRGLLEADFRGSALIPIVDPPAVATAFEAGVGRIIRLVVGGAMDTGRFMPVPMEARVHILSVGCFQSESHRTEWNAGRTAVLKSGGLTLIVTSRAVSLYDRSLFLAHGQDPRTFDTVVVKSPHCQYQFFAAWAARMLNVDAPGSTSANLPRLGHTKCPRPIFPLDEGVDFQPRPERYQRG